MTCSDSAYTNHGYCVGGCMVRG